ncbi:MAG: orange carotenoid protein N-terminal domain-containing protein [Cyanobacteria bacterium J06636_16]
MATPTNATNDTDKATEIFYRLSIDDQLAWLWYAYKQMGNALTTAAPGAASSEISGGLVKQVEAMSQSDQLEAMRAIARRDQDNRISREYGSLSANTKLAFWYELAVGMDSGSIMPMPPQYDMKDTGRDLLATVETMDFESQITILRNAVVAMGAEPLAGAAI